MSVIKEIFNARFCRVFGTTGFISSIPGDFMQSLWWKYNYIGIGYTVLCFVIMVAGFLHLIAARHRIPLKDCFICPHCGEVSDWFKRRVLAIFRNYFYEYQVPANQWCSNYVPANQWCWDCLALPPVVFKPEIIFVGEGWGQVAIARSNKLGYLVRSTIV